RYTYNNEAVTIKRTESFRKPKGWHVELIEEEQEAEIVRFIFDHFAKEAPSYGRMLRLLEDMGYRSPGGQWHLSGLRYLLTNKAYIGVLEVGRDRFNAHKAQPSKFSKMKPVEKPGIFPALVNKDTFKEVQNILKRRRENNGDSIPKGDA